MASKKKEVVAKVTTTKQKMSGVKLHKYYKRMLALMPKDKRNDFKNLMIGAIHAEKAFKENARKSKEKNSSD